MTGVLSHLPEAASSMYVAVVCSNLDLSQQRAAILTIVYCVSLPLSSSLCEHMCALVCMRVC